MDKQQYKRVARRLSIELLAVGILAGFDDFPKTGSAAENWSYIGSHLTLLFHIIVGTLVLAEAIMLLVRVLRGRNLRQIIPTTGGLVFVLLAYGAGQGYVATHGFLDLMTLGWFLAMVIYVVIWIQNRKKRPARESDR